MRKREGLALLLGLVFLLTVPVRAEELPTEPGESEIVTPEEPAPAEPAEPELPPPEPTPEEPPPEEPIPEEPTIGEPIALPAAPAILSEPEDVYIAVGENVVLRVEAASFDGGSLGYQWFRGVNESKASMHPVSGNGQEFCPDTSTAGVFYYYVSVSNSLNGQTACTESRVAAVNVGGAGDDASLKPKILAQPGGAELDYGGKRTLSVTAESAGDTLSYQWYVCPEPDASGAVPLGTDREQQADSTHPGVWYYFVRVSASDGERSAETDSDFACIRVGSEKPVIVTPPQSITVTQGERCAVSVTAKLKGHGKLSYVWYQSTRPEKDTMTVMNWGNDMGDTLVLDSSRPSVRYYYVEVCSTENEEVNRVSSGIVTVRIEGAEKEFLETEEDMTPSPLPAERPPEETPVPTAAAVTTAETGEGREDFPLRLGAAALLGCVLGFAAAKILKRVLRK